MELGALYEHLDRAYDLGDWWPTESALEVMVGAILVQRTNWRNASLALVNLKKEGILSIPYLRNIPEHELQRLIRPAGFHRQKTERIKNLADLIAERFEEREDLFLSRDMGTVRKELLTMKGIGKETADAILLYGGGHPTFVAASYVSRIFNRTGVLFSQDYDEIRDFVLSEYGNSPEDCASLYSLLVHHA